LTGAIGPAGPIGATGPQGIQGTVGPAGPAGSNGINGTEIFYFNGVPTNTPATGSFSVDDVNNTLYYYTGTAWIQVWVVGQSTGSTTNFQSGSGAPSGSSVSGTIYLDVVTGTVYQYTGASWQVVPMAYAVTIWVTPALTSPYVSGSSTVQYRQQGGMVKIKGNITGPVTNITTDVVLFTLPASYRPTDTKYFSVVNIYTGTTGIVRINNTGNVTIMGTLKNIPSNGLVFDNLFFELT
jgi:hypothetical protein